MFKLAYELIKDFGALGIGVVQFGVILFFGFKLFTNHLKHITTKINSLCSRVGIFENELNKTKERVAKVEGKLEG